MMRILFPVFPDSNPHRPDDSAGVLPPDEAMAGCNHIDGIPIFTTSSTFFKSKAPEAIGYSHNTWPHVHHLFPHFILKSLARSNVLAESIIRKRSLSSGI